MNDDDSRGQKPTKRGVKDSPQKEQWQVRIWGNLAMGLRSSEGCVDPPWTRLVSVGLDSRSVGNTSTNSASEGTVLQTYDRGP